MSEFEIDRTASGKMRVNVISIANLVALLGLIGVAVSTWTTLNSKVDTMNVRVESATASVAQIRADFQASLLSRENDARELRSKVENINNRMTAVETVLQRVERAVTDQPRLPR